MDDIFTFDDPSEAQPPDESDRELEADLGLQSGDEADAMMSEAEKRFRLGSYYRELMRTPIFSDGSEEANTVAKEVRLFAKERMEVLFGMKAEQSAVVPPQALPFDEDEIAALKLLAARLTKKPTLLDPPAPPKVVTAKAPEPVPVAPRRQAPTPAPAAPTQSSKPAAPTPPRPPKVAPKAAGKKAPPGKRPEDLPSGVPFKIGRKVYQWEDGVDEKGRKRRWKKDITPVERPAQMTPMPMNMNAATERLAEKSRDLSSDVFDRKTSREGISRNPDSVVKADGTIEQRSEPTGADLGQ